MYDGKEDFLDWIKGVQLQADIHGWTPEQAGEAARMRLVDAAANRLISQGLNTGPVTLDQLSRQLKPFFPSKHTRSLDALLNIKLEKDEHIRDYAKRLEDAFLHHDSTFSDKTRMDMFCRGLEAQIPFMSVDLIREVATTMKQAVEMAVSRIELDKSRGQSAQDSTKQEDARVFINNKTQPRRGGRQQTRPRAAATETRPYCDFHKRPGHSTDECEARKRSIADTSGAPKPRDNFAPRRDNGHKAQGRKGGDWNKKRPAPSAASKDQRPFAKKSKN